MFQQQEKRNIVGKQVSFRPSTIMLCGSLKLVLSPPIIAYDYGGKDLYYYNRIITVLTPNRGDRADALAGREVKESIEVEPDMPDTPLESLPPAVTVPERGEDRAQETAVTEKDEAKAEEKPAKPTPAEDADRQKFLIAPLCPECGSKLVPMRGLYCQSCGVTLPSKLAVHREVIVAIRKADYDKLADYLKQEINAAWSQLRRGRKIGWEAVSQGQGIFLLVVENEYKASTLAEEQKLSTILEETGAGRLTVDPYELRELHKRMEKQPAYGGNS